MSFDLAAVTTGAGDDVVLVHGALGDRRQWQAIAAMLADRYRVHAVSRRHHWPHASPSADVRYTYEGHCDDLVAMLETFAAPVHLVGHSYGAGVALLAALRKPALIRSLVLIEPAFGSLLPEAAPGLAEERANRIAWTRNVSELVETAQDHEAAELFIDWVQGEAGGFSKLSAEAREVLLANARTLGPTLSAPQPEVTPAHLRNLRMPTLVVNGATTRPWYRFIGQTTAACVPGAKATVVAGCGHMAIVERPDAAATLLGQFFER